MAKSIAVVGAVVVRDGVVLCAQRGPHGALPDFWEFPGGKVEPGEDPRAALEREIVEELGCSISVGGEVTTTTFEYPFAVITLTTYWTAVNEGEPTASEHAELRWLAPDELRTVTWAPADVPAVELVEEHLRVNAT